MPRKKVDPAADVLQYFTEQPYDVASVVFSLVKGVMARRAPQPEPKAKTRRTRKVVALVADVAPDPLAQAILEQPMPATVTAPKRRRRLRADSPRPSNEATPIVPLQSEVGGEGDEAYTGE